MTAVTVRAANSDEAPPDLCFFSGPGSDFVLKAKLKNLKSKPQTIDFVNALAPRVHGSLCIVALSEFKLRVECQ